MQERRALFSIGVTYQTPHDKLAAIPGMIRSIIESRTDVRFDRAGRTPCPRPGWTGLPRADPGGDSIEVAPRRSKSRFNVRGVIDTRHLLEKPPAPPGN